MRLLIRNQNEELVIDSDLSDKNKHILGIYPKGSGENFTIEISLPKDIDNDFSKLFAKITWRFSYDVLEQDNELAPNTGMGDFEFDTSITVFLISWLGLLIVLFMGKKESENIENKKLKKGK